jgi:predicted dehydrogenase
MVLRIGVLGTARITAKALLRPAAEVQSVTVSAVAARDGSRAEAFALQHGIPVCHGSYQELLADPEVDAVYIPLPNGLHAPWTLRAIAAGKHVLCEKPFASNASESAQVEAAAAASGLVVMEAMHYRYHPRIERMVSLVADGAIGTVSHVQCWTCWAVPNLSDIRYDYALGGGALMDGGCYALDCMRLFGEPSVTAALADPVGGPPTGRAVDRAMAVRLSFGPGMTGWFESAFTRDGEFRADVHVAGDEGSLWLRNFINARDGRLTVTRNGSAVPVTDPADSSGPDSSGPDSSGAGGTTFAFQLRAFAAAVADGAPFPTTAASATSTMRLIDDAYRAAGLPPRGGS